MAEIYNFTLEKADGDLLSLSDYKGKVLLIVNTATACGFTPQYKDLQKFHEAYHEKGLEIIDIPCNQFGGQAPGSDSEIESFCTLNYHTGFKQLKKAEVNGENELPLYTFLKEEKGFEDAGSGIKGLAMKAMLKMKDKDYKKNADIKWNFTKFLVDRNGTVTERFEPAHDMKTVEEKIKELL